MKPQGIIEIKVPKMATHYRYLMSDKAPAEYRAQMLHNVWVTGAAWCAIAHYGKSHEARKATAAKVGA